MLFNLGWKVGTDFCGELEEKESRCGDRQRSSIVMTKWYWIVIIIQRSVTLPKPYRYLKSGARAFLFRFLLLTGCLS
jgi:hypothetical protein